MALRSARYSDEALMEVFGTTGIGDSSIIRWKQGWRDTNGKIKVNNFSEAVKLLAESDVDPLFYQFQSEPADRKNSYDEQGADKHYIVFYKDEHEVFFKLHQGLA